MNDAVIEIDNVNSRLITTNSKIKKILSEKLRFRPKNYFHSSAYKSKKWDGWKNFFSEKSGAFLTGILPEVRFALEKLKIEPSSALKNLADTVSSVYFKIGMILRLSYADFINIYIFNLRKCIMF